MGTKIEVHQKWEVEYNTNVITDSWKSMEVLAYTVEENWIHDIIPIQAK